MGTQVPVIFRFPGALARAARGVTVVGSFNDWSPTAHPLKKNPDGDWTTIVPLPPGRVVYCFWVDGTIWLDPCDDGREPNVWGSEYSVRHVQIDIMRPGLRSA